MKSRKFLVERGSTFHYQNGQYLKKGCEKMSVKDEKLDQIIKTVEENDIKFLKLQLSDIHGLPKSMAVPLMLKTL